MLPLLRGEVALVVTPRIPAPVLTLVAPRHRRDAHARGARRAPGPAGAAAHAARRGPAALPAPTVAGERAYAVSLCLGARARLRGLRRKPGRLHERRRHRRGQGRKGGTRQTPAATSATLGDRPERRHVASLPRLRPAPRARRSRRGSTTARPTCAVRDDLQQVRAVGVVHDRRGGRHRPRSFASRSHDQSAFRQRVPVHLRVGDGGPPGQDRRPDLRRRPRRRACATTRRAAWPARRS